MPWTIAAMLSTLDDESDGRVVTAPFDDRLASSLTAVIRSLAKAECTLDDVALAGAWIGAGGLAFMSDGVSLPWLAKIGNLSDAIGKARRWDEDGRPHIDDGGGRRHEATTEHRPEHQVIRFGSDGKRAAS